MKLVRSLLSVIICLLLVGPVFAQDEPETLPDDPLYQAKRQMETAKLNAVFDPLEKATLHIKYARKRLAEVKAMVSKGKPEFVEGLMKDYENSISGAMTNIERAANQGRDVTEALEAVERSTRKHTEVLMDLLGKVPEQAKPAITHAIEKSKQGRNRALDVLNRIQRGELPIGKPEGVGKPKGVGKPEGIGKPKRVEKPKGAGRKGAGIKAGRRNGGRGR